MRASILIDNAQVPARFRTLAGAIKPDVALAVYRTGAMYRTRVRAAASGRPGPRVQTGDYRRAISQTNTTDNGVPVALVHTNKPQAARLEYGFVGIDAAGRRYNQPPYPHWAPAAEGLHETLENEIQKTVDIALSKVWRAP